MSLTTKFKTTRINLRLGTRETVEDNVAVEAPLNIYVNDEHVVTLMATPVQKKELAVGWLLDEGITRSPNEISDLWIKENDVKIKTKSALKMRIKAARTARLITTACGSVEDFLKLLDRMDKPFVKSDYQVKAEDILRMIQELNQRSQVFRSSGGTHSAALFIDGSLVAFAEDVGRHNAIDKVIGTAALAKANFAHAVIVSSGRQPADMVLKAARVGIPILVSIAGPIQSGVVVAEKTGITLVCFARGQRMNVYTSPDRILGPR